MSNIDHVRQDKQGYILRELVQDEDVEVEYKTGRYYIKTNGGEKMDNNSSDQTQNSNRSQKEINNDNVIND